jgi:hypothetical protein
MGDWSFEETMGWMSRLTVSSTEVMINIEEMPIQVATHFEALTTTQTCILSNIDQVDWFGDCNKW